MPANAIAHQFTPVTLHPAKIVVAEDEEMLGTLIASKLRRAGYDVKLTRDGNAAWAAILADPPDLIVLDWMMPGMNGVELLSLVRDRPATRLTPVIMLTAVAQKSEVLTALDMGASDYVLKPFQPNHLLARVRKQLAAGKHTRDDSPLPW